MSKSKVLEEAYNEYRRLGFILQKSAKYKKHAHRKGAYIDRDNEDFEESATGYVGIIPPSLIIVDNDRYEDDGESFTQLLKDLKLDYTPTPFALTPSGGEHYAFNNPDPDLVIGNLGKTYRALDIYAGYQSVLPIVGTTVENKQGNLASYTWGDPILESLVINPSPSTITKVLKMRKRAEGGASKDYDEDNTLSVAVKASEMSDAEVDEHMANLPDDMHYDDWLAVAMCLYDRYEGGEEGLKKLQEFGERSAEKNDANRTESKWYSGHFKPTQTSFTRLRSISHESKLNKVKEDINKGDDKSLKKLIKTISDTPYLNTRVNLDGDVREELSELINLRYKELKKTGDFKGGIPQARSIVKELAYVPTMEDVPEEEGYDVDIYISGTKYVLRIGTILMEDLSESFLKKHLILSGVSPKFVDAYIRDAKLISGVEMTTDYLLDRPIEYRIEKSQAIEKLPVLTLAKDPFYSVVDYVEDKEILTDFFDKVWNGKAKDIIELIALTIRYKEWKLNRLMIVAPSDTGKTTLTEHLGFQKIHMQRLLSAMRGDKGIGTNVINGVKNSGLLLIDEANKSLEQDIKDMDRELYVDEFGSGGGTQKIRLHFTALTSTHKKATRNSSDELYNRFLQVELTENEMEHTITKSEVYRRDTEKYSEVVKGYSQFHFKECLRGEKYTKEYLHELQAKYRLPLNTDLEEFLYTVSESAMEHIKHTATSNGDILVKQGEYFIKRKVDLFNMVEEMINELPNIDTGKYADKIINHFIRQNSKSIKINGTPVKYYPIEMTPYVQDEEQRVVELFEDLDA